MTPDERKMLDDLADKFAKTPSPPKDQEAEDFIRTRIGNRPDALYLMTQTVLIQNLALEHAQQQIQELQQRAGQPVQAGSGSFLAQTAQASGYGSGQRGSQSYAPPPPQYAPPTASAPSPSTQPSFLRGAAQTAAGIAAGALAFEGIRSLFSGPGYGGSGFLGGTGGIMGGAPGEEIINNYYDSPAGSDRDDFQAADRNDYQNANDYQNVDDDTGQYDASGSDDSGQYDDASNDSGDGGGFDSGSGGDFA